MHGLVFRSFQNFVTLTYGPDVWVRVVRRADLPNAEFEAMLTYDSALGQRLLRAAGTELCKPSSAMLEDMGTFLVAHPQMDNLRRLLRFGGGTYCEFLHSLDDLADRTRLAVPDMTMPHLSLQDHANHTHILFCTSPHPFFGLVLVGMLRAMADDYGALAVVEHKGRDRHVDKIEIILLESDYADGNAFDLGGGLRERRATAQ